MTGNICIINPLLWHTLEHRARALASFERLTTLMTQTGQSSRHRRNTTPRPLQQEDYKGPLNYREINTESRSYYFDALTILRKMLRKRRPTTINRTKKLYTFDSLWIDKLSVHAYKNYKGICIILYDDVVE